MRWKIYYDDRTTFSSDDGTWQDAPTDGVLFVVQWVDGSKRIMSGNDFYVMRDGEIHETQDLGPILRQLGIVKFGRWTSHRRMEEAAEMVRRDT